VEGEGTLVVARVAEEKTMHPLFNATFAKQHIEQLRSEALAQRNAAQLEAYNRRLEGLEGAGVHWHSLGLLRLYWAHVVSLFGRTVIIHQVKSDVRKFEEVQQELHTVLTSMHEAFPDYDEQFVKQVVQSLEDYLRAKSRSNY
jgi:hypothetical protein